MEEMDKIKKMEKLINKLNNKEFGIYFFTLDTKGNPVAGVANIYENAKLLRELGYNAQILHEKNDYHKVGQWLGEEYDEIPHVSIESQELTIDGSDFIVIPEVFSSIMAQVKNFPCKKIVLCQSYSYALELIPPGVRWDLNFNFNDVITTSETQAKYIQNMFKGIKTHVVPVSIPDYFKKSEEPKKPIVAIVSRNQQDTVALVKRFYLEYPMFKWVKLEDLRGMSRRDFADSVGESCLAVWVDPNAGFGTFPIEAMECETPVIGIIPDMIPEYLVGRNDDEGVVLKNNGIWLTNKLDIPAAINDYLMGWIEDNVPNVLYDNMAKTTGLYTVENQKNIISEVYENLVSDRVGELTDVLNKSKLEIDEN